MSIKFSVLKESKSLDFVRIRKKKHFFIHHYTCRQHKLYDQKSLLL